MQSSLTTSAVLRQLVGQYQRTRRASFHLILHGGCLVDVGAGRDTLTLAAGDGIFVLRDIPHALTPLGLAAADGGRCAPMRPLPAAGRLD